MKSTLYAPQKSVHHRSCKARLAAACMPTLLAGLVLVAPASHAKDETTPLTVDAGFNASEAAAKGFTVADSAALKGIKRVAVPVFAVEFIVADNVSASTSSFGAAGRSTSSLYYKLLGVGEADFQAITDALYQQFLGELKASGVDVLDATQVTAAPTYRKLVATGSPAPIKSDSSLVMSPRGLGIYGFARMAAATAASARTCLRRFQTLALVLLRWAPSATPCSWGPSWTPA